MDFLITTHVSNLDDDDVDVNGTSHYVTSLKIRGLVRVTSIVPLLLLSIVSQLILIGVSKVFIA